MSTEAQAALRRLPTRKIARYGWKPDLPDMRDHIFAASRVSLAALPPKIDLRDNNKWPAVYDQGQIGSCTANSIGGAFEFLTIKEGLEPDFMPSRLFIYYNERSMEGTITTDAGAQIRDGIKSVATLGVCPETMWPYDATAADPNTSVWPAGAKPATQPPPECYTEGLKNVAVSYTRVIQNLDQMRGCLADGYPFVFGFTVYASFESQAVARTGIVPMPGANEETIGGHAVCALGYDDSKQMFLVRNSWGPDWGVQGHFWIPYAYLTNDNLASDFWTIRKNT